MEEESSKDWKKVQKLKEDSRESLSASLILYQRQDRMFYTWVMQSQSDQNESSRIFNIFKFEWTRRL